MDSLPSEITLALVVAVLTVIIGVTVKLIGFPAQFRLNYGRKSTKGLSTLFILLSVASYILWTLHGMFQGDWVLIVGQGIGIVTSGAILAQIVFYRNRKEDK